MREYLPSRWADEFHSLTTRYALGGGSAGPGKTEELIRAPLPQIDIEHKRCKYSRSNPLYHPWGSSEGHALFLRRLDKQLSDTQIRMFSLYRSVDPGCQWIASKSWFLFSSGYRVQLGHCKEKTDWNLYLGGQYTLILYDELNQFLEMQWEWINSRLRSSDPVLRPMMKVRAMSNPVLDVKSDEDFSVDDPFWVRRVFVDPAPGGRVRLVKKIKMRSGEVREVDFFYLPATLDDNPDKEFRDDYELNLQEKSPRLKKALLDGDWYYVAGAFHSEDWDKDIHVIQPYKVNREWPRFRVLDWGSKTQGCIQWYHLDHENNLVCEKEVLFKGKSPTEVSRDIIKPYEEREGLWNKSRGCSDIIGPADTQLWEERDGHSATKYLEFMKAGVPWVQADKWRRKRNAEHLTDRLRDTRGGTMPPGFMLFRGVEAAARLIPSVPTDPKDSNAPADFQGDHAYDCVLYACAYASKGLPKRRVGLDRPEQKRQYRAGFGWMND